MDDLFQYLIWGIIIFSFLSSFFKKKEPPKQKTPLPRTKPQDSISYPKQTTEVERVAVSQKQDEYDILRELENLFKGNTNIPTQNIPPQQQSRDYIDREIKDKDLDLVIDPRMQRTVEDKKPIGSRVTYDDKNVPNRSLNDRQAQPRIINPKIEEQAKEFERVLAGPLKQRTAVTEFNRKLKNPRTVREYILFSEILGKPKALRR
jgi:hypothetical protein